MEGFVAKPATEERSWDGCELVGKIGPAGALKVYAFVGQYFRSPVQAAIAHHVDECVGKSDVPKQLVA